MSPAARISLIYLVLGSAWILASDAVLDFFTQGSPPAYAAIQTVKGWIYVSASAAVLYLLLRREFNARQHSEKRALEGEARFHYLFESNPLPMCVFDRDTLGFTDVNEAACVHYGYSRDEFLSMKITDIRPREDVPVLLDYLESHPAPMRMDTGEWRHQKKNGEVIDVQVSAHSLDFAGKPAVLAVMLDITERKRAESERLENARLRLILKQEAELKTMRSSFVSMVSHEFRRPLTTVTASVELLENYRSRMTDDAAQKHFTRIHEQLAEMKELLDDFLTLMREEAEESDFKPTQVDLTELCRKLADEVKLADAAAHTFNCSSNCERIFIYGDEKLLRHAVGNLLSNAVKYSPEGGEIRLEVKRVQHSVEIHVADQGVGIPEEEQERVFDPFFRARNVGDVSGTGLGLPIARRAVTSHGGTLAIARSAPGGTEFVITLPLDERAILTGC